jgi:hypothetical protein
MRCEARRRAAVRGGVAAALLVAAGCVANIEEGPPGTARDAATGSLDGDPQLGEADAAPPDAAAPVDAAPDASVSPEGLVALYAFDEGSGGVARDSSGFGEPLDLVITQQSAVQWLDGALELVQPTALTSSALATKISAECAQAGAISIEARVVTTDRTLDGPTRIVSLSDSISERNFTLGTSLEQLVFRLRTTETGLNGTPSLDSPEGAVSGELIHVAVVGEVGGSRMMYIDGVLVAEDAVEGDFSSWSDAFQLWVGNEASFDRPWLGELHELAIYCRARGAEELAAAAHAVD